MKFTIVTPSYNQGQFIEQTIISVLSQEGDFFIDYIIADGGSTDNTVEVIKKYDTLLRKGLYPIKCNGVEFRWWSKKDKGQTDAINQGFKIASGEILAWINSDDFYEPNAFQEVKKIFNKHQELELVYGDGYKVEYGKNTKIIKESFEGSYNDFLRRYRFIFQPSAFWKKSLLDKMGLLDENLNYVMDYNWWLRTSKIDKNKRMHVHAVWSNALVWTSSKSVSQIDKLLKEKRVMLKKYGGNIIDPYFIQRVINSRYYRSFRKMNPYLADKIQKIIFAITDTFHY